MNWEKVVQSGRVSLVFNPRDCIAQPKWSTGYSNKGRKRSGDVVLVVVGWLLRLEPRQRRKDQSVRSELAHDVRRAMEFGPEARPGHHRLAGKGTKKRNSFSSLSRVVETSYLSGCGGLYGRLKGPFELAAEIDAVLVAGDGLRR